MLNSLSSGSLRIAMVSYLRCYKLLVALFFASSCFAPAATIDAIVGYATLFLVLFPLPIDERMGDQFLFVGNGNRFV